MSSVTVYLVRVKSGTLALLYPLFAVTTWGTNIVAGRFLVYTHGVSGIALSYLRFLLAVPMLLALAIVTMNSRVAKINAKDLPLLGVGGLLGVALFNVMLYSSLEYITASTSAFLASMSSPITYIILVVAGLEKAELKPITGVILSITGLYILLANGIGVYSVKGVLYALIAALSWSGYTILVKILSSKYNPLQILVWATITGTIMLTPATVNEKLLYTDPIIISLILYIAAVPGALGYLAWNIGVEKAGPTKSAVFIPCVPLVATSLGLVLLGEPLSASQFIGGVLIVVGILMVIK